NNACQANLGITKVASPSPASAGSNLTYTLTVTNSGPGTAYFITVFDDLPAGTTFVSCAATGGGLCGGSGNHRAVSFPSLAANASATITLVADVPCSVASGTMLSNTATATSAVTPDPTPDNNAMTIITNVNNACPADVAITKAEAPDPVSTG